MKITRTKLILMVGLMVALGAYVWTHRMGVPEDFADQQTQFKYGSIGTDHPMTRAPIPYWIWRVLPQMFTPSKVIKAGFGPANDMRSYAAFGLAYEESRQMPRGWVAGQPTFDRPIGMSKRSAFGLDFVGVNCSFCHTTLLRKSADDKQVVIIPGGTGNTIDIEKYFLYLFAAFSDPGFTADAVMAEIAKVNPQMGFVERSVHRYVLIPLMKHVVPDLIKQFDFIDPANPNRLPKFGPGRVDTWAVYKRTFVHPPQDDTTAGVADFPAIWNQQAKLGMRLHWDGNTNVLQERNIISALALIGPRLEYMDVERLNRVADYSLGLLPPRYNDLAPGVYTGKGEDAPRITKRQADISAGRVLFENRCAGCHAPTGLRIGRVEPLQYGQATEPDRLKAFTHELADALNQLQTSAWQLRGFKPQEGYTNMLLDGIWLRGPYLHNGSVPTLADLLKYPEDRPKQFCRGSDVFDWVNIGFVSALGPDPAKPCGEHFLFDTSLRGNRNQGHVFGTDASPEEKAQLIEFLKTL